MTAEFDRALDQAAEVLARHDGRIRDALQERGIDFDDVIEYARGGSWMGSFGTYAGALGASILVGSFMAPGRA